MVYMYLYIISVEGVIIIDDRDGWAIIVLVHNLDLHCMFIFSSIFIIKFIKFSYFSNT